MIPLEYVAGFSGKDLMAILYIPAMMVLVIGSILLCIKRRQSHPYVPVIVAFWIAGILWYFYDKFFAQKVDRGQELLVAGLGLTIAILALADSSLIPDNGLLLNAFALIAFGASIVMVRLAFRKSSR